MSHQSKDQVIISLCLPRAALIEVDKRAAAAKRSQAAQIAFDLDRVYRADRAQKGAGQ